MNETTYTAFFPFCGLGAGARGFLDAEVRLFGRPSRFECLGGIDFDPVACADFEQLTGTKAWCTSVEEVTPAALRERYGDRAPDVVFMSPPCKGASRLLGAKKAASAKYQTMNRLAVLWTKTMLDAWAIPPSLVLLENVPGLPTRAAPMLRELRAILKSRGYVFHTGTHDCGELGGLAQHRTRFLLVARHPDLCPPLLYQPPKKRVRGVGEVLSALPMPATEASTVWGKLHTMPALSWRNWLRLALIPKGGDWRDLEGVLAGRARREVYRRHAVADWQEPIDAITGPGGHSVEAVADPRGVAMRARDWGGGTLGVLPFDEPSRTIAGESNPSNGRYSVADPRAGGLLTGGTWHHGAFGVRPWEEPAATVTSGDHPSKGRFAVADPRVELHCAPFPGAYGVNAWDHPIRTISGASKIDNRPVSVADPRVLMKPSDKRHWSKLDVRDWSEPALTVIGKEGPANGGPSVADPRVAVTSAYDRGYGVLGWEDPSPTVAGTVAAGTGAYAVADPRARTFLQNVRVLTLDEAMALDLDPAKPPPFIPVIVAEDGTWHRPLTLLELAALQGIPSTLNGLPLQLHGTRTQIAEHVGNAVPVATACAIAEQMLVALSEASAGTFSMSGGSVWVVPTRDAAMLGAG